LNRQGVGAGLNGVGAGFKPAPTVGKRHGLPEIIHGFKTFSSRRINELRDNTGVPVWQRNYYERVIRNDRELAAIREYIGNNPVKWAMDRENPANCHM
jgi:putative transposase